MPAKKNYYKNKQMRDHEERLALIKVLQGPSGFDTLLWLGMAAGYGISAAASLLAKYLGVTVNDDGTATDAEGNSIDWQGMIKGFVIAGPGGAFLGTQDFGGLSADSDGLLGLAGKVPATFGNACLFLLSLRSIFGTGSGGSTGGGTGLLSGII